MLDIRRPVASQRPRCEGLISVQSTACWNRWGGRAPGLRRTSGAGGADAVGAHSVHLSCRTVVIPAFAEPVPHLRALCRRRIADICEASAPLWDRLEARQLNKPVFNRPPREQARPQVFDSPATLDGSCG